MNDHRKLHKTNGRHPSGIETDCDIVLEGWGADKRDAKMYNDGNNSASSNESRSSTDVSTSTQFSDIDVYRYLNTSINDSDDNSTTSITTSSDTTASDYMSSDDFSNICTHCQCNRIDNNSSSQSEILLSQVYPRDLDELSAVETGLVYRTHKSFRGAIEMFDRAIELNPRNANYFYYRAVTYIRLNCTLYVHKITKDLAMAVKLNPYHWNACSLLAMKYIELDWFNEAYPVLNQIMIMKPKSEIFGGILKIVNEKLIQVAEESAEAEVGLYLNETPRRYNPEILNAVRLIMTNPFSFNIVFAIMTSRPPEASRLNNIIGYWWKHNPTVPTFRISKYKLEQYRCKIESAPINVITDTLLLDRCETFMCTGRKRKLKKRKPKRSITPQIV